MTEPEKKQEEKKQEETKQEEKKQEEKKQEEKKQEEKKQEGKNKKVQKELEKSNYYFKIIPKEEFPKFMERLKVALSKIENKKNEKKSLNLEVRGSKEDLKGLAFEIFSFDKDRCSEFMDVNETHIKNALYCTSLNLNVKTENDVNAMKETYEQFKPMFAAIPGVGDKFEFAFRSKGTKVSFDIVAKNGKLVKSFIDLGINPSEYHKFNFALKSGIDLGELFNQTADQKENFVKICSVIFSIESETYNVKYLAGALSEALKDVKLTDPNIQEKFNKCVGYLNFINSFVGVKLNLEYDAKTLAGEGAKEAEKMSGGAEGFKSRIIATQQIATGMANSVIAPIIAGYGLIDKIKVIDLDSISISLGIPQYQHGYAISFKIPGLSNFLETILNAQPQQQNQQK